MIEDVEPTDEERTCSCCGDEREVIGYEETEKLEYEPASCYLRVIRRPKLVCKKHEEAGVTSPDLPPQALHKGLAGATMLAQTVTAKHCDHLPACRRSASTATTCSRSTRRRAKPSSARAGDGPTFLELVTYRRLGHSSSDDPSRYRDEAEVAEWEKRDPVERFRRHLESESLWDEDKEAARRSRSRSTPRSSRPKRAARRRHGT